MTPTPVPTSTATAILGMISPDDPLFPVLFNIGKALVILLVSLVLAGAGKRWTVHLMTRGKRRNLNVASLVGNLVQVGIVVLGLINVLVAFGVDLASLVTVLGVAGLAISLSLQDLLRNVVAGIYVLMEQPFKIGDKITVKEVTGTVQAIELRTTVLRTDDGLQVVVPNNTVLNEVVTNRSASTQQKTVVRVRVNAADAGDLQGLNEEITKALANIDGIGTSPAPTVAMEGIHQGVARLKVEFWHGTGQKSAVAARVIDALRARWNDANMVVVE